MGKKSSVKVLIRTRPTANFASKNIQIDPTNQVILLIRNSFKITDIDCDSINP